MSLLDGWDTLQEFKVHLMGMLAVILYRLMATILLALERCPSCRGPGIRSDLGDLCRPGLTSVRISSTASPEKSHPWQDDTN